MFRRILHRPPREHIAHFTDASLRKSKLGLGVFNHQLTSAAVVLKKDRDIHFGEMTAILLALRQTPFGAPVVIHTDSDAALHHIHASKSTCNTKYRDICGEINTTIRANRNNVWFVNVKSHSGVYGNDVADSLARRGTEVEDGELLELMDNLFVQVCSPARNRIVDFDSKSRR
jgi:hypothetical protein